MVLAGDDEVGQLAHAFNHMTASLQRTEQARRQLVADVAHELRTPLTVIDGTVQAMQDGVLPVDEANLATIHEEVAALSHLVTDLRDLSLGDVGEFPIRPELMDVGALVERVAGAFAAEAAARGVALQADVAPALPQLRADPERLQQCLRNLVVNALQHTPPGGRIIARAAPVAGGVEIAVSDSGSGIAPEHLPHVFERFYRADASRARRSGGTGLGLAIVQQIVAAHGGTVAATSAGPGRGATFTIRLPATGPNRTSHVPAQDGIDLLPGVLEDVPNAGQGRRVGSKDAALGK
jgi:signal transduction histidine kinase